MARDKLCKICGEKFPAIYPNSQYCKKCKPVAIEQNRQRHNAASLKKYHERNLFPPRPITCAKCGNTFTGRYQQKYCPECLRTGTGRMKKYKANRKEFIE